MRALSHRSRFLRATFAASLAMVASCNDSDEDCLETKASPLPFAGEPCASADDATCGYRPNGPELNGTSIEGDTLEALSYAGMAAADGTRVTAASIKDGELIALAGDVPVAVPGLVLAGNRRSAKGLRKPVTLRIENVVKEGTLTTYDLRVVSSGQPGGSKCGPVISETRVCGVGADGQPRRAVLVDAKWSYESGVAGGGARVESAEEFTVACLGTGAIAKCVELGYLPWASRPDCVASTPGCATLAAHHQACVRALRADFCNNGFPLTEAGTLVRIYDTLMINKDTPGKGEASWAPAGALCISETRLESVVTTFDPARVVKVRNYINDHCPGKFTAVGRGNWGGLCIDAQLPEADQIFTEYPAPM